MNTLRPIVATLAGIGLLAGTATPAAAQFRNELRHNTAYCRAGAGPAVNITVSGVKSGGGTLRVQLYRGIRADWLESGRWVNRIELPARAGTMQVCMPVPVAGTYAIAIRHDINNNGKTDLTTDGGGMSNNPSINIFNLGRPSYTRTAFPVAAGEVKAITITMKYM
ncbi:DUF2141 domain-containing protein [Croceibacterium sp. TMG7-5b_MA50]|uniref:DUF2141 domain-containing protein n=1 Tax=Croceibacterium sp. TMG7-5b_MA50 TaxID=3121290 RepID=UPI00322219CE